MTLATVVARLASGVLNFGLNRGFSFQDLGSGSGDVRTQGVRYTMLFLVQMCASALLVVALSIMPLPLVMVKAFVDGSLFVLSYFVQRNWVFKRDTHMQAVRAKGGKRGEVKSKKTYSAI